MSQNAPTFAVMGAGAIGAYFGGRLAAGGSNVAFIARGDHLAAMRATGLTIHSPLGDVTLDPVTATDDPAEIGPAIKRAFASGKAALIDVVIDPEVSYGNMAGRSRQQRTY